MFNLLIGRVRVKYEEEKTEVKMSINNENASDYNVLQLVKDAESKQLFIPEFQRHFIWEKTQIKLLMDSIYRKYTFSSILIWNGTEELARRRVGGNISEILEPGLDSQNTVSYILDGQQRTTSLLLSLSDAKIFKGKNTQKTEKRILYRGYLLDSSTYKR